MLAGLSGRHGDRAIDFTIFTMFTAFFNNFVNCYHVYLCGLLGLGSLFFIFYHDYICLFYFYKFYSPIQPPGTSGLQIPGATFFFRKPLKNAEKLSKIGHPRLQPPPDRETRDSYFWPFASIDTIHPSEACGRGCMCVRVRVCVWAGGGRGGWGLGAGAGWAGLGWAGMAAWSQGSWFRSKYRHQGTYKAENEQNILLEEQPWGILASLP